MQYARSKVDYVISEFIYMLLSDMDLRIGRVQGYNNKISRTGFKIGTNLKIKLDVKSKEVEIVKTKPDVKQKEEPDVKSNKEHKQDVKPNIELKHDVKKPDTNKMITSEEEKVALILGTTAVFTVWWMFK